MTESCQKTVSAARVTYNRRMHIIAIGWLYVVALMTLTERNLVAGALTLLFYGLLPVALLLWLFGGPGRRRHAARQAAQDSRTDSGDEDPAPPP